MWKLQEFIKIVILFFCFRDEDTDDPALIEATYRLWWEWITRIHRQSGSDGSHLLSVGKWFDFCKPALIEALSCGKDAEPALIEVTSQRYDRKRGRSTGCPSWIMDYYYELNLQFTILYVNFRIKFIYQLIPCVVTQGLWAIITGSTRAKLYVFSNFSGSRVCK
jgi:hypothetical protein